MTKREIECLTNAIMQAAEWVKSLKEEDIEGDDTLDESLNILGDTAHLLACRCNGVVSGFFGDEIDEIDRRL